MTAGEWDEGFGEGDGLGGGLVHLPVCGDEELAHGVSDPFFLG
jgi:hypothetical protein